MARPFPSLHALRSTLPSVPFSSPSPIASCSYIQTRLPSRSFSSSPPTSLSKKVKAIRSRKAFIEAKRSKKGDGQPDFVLGHINSEPTLRGGRVEVGKPIKDLWQGCRLSKVLLHPQAVWNSPIPNYAAGEKPKFLLPGLSDENKQMLFGAVPHVTTALKFNPETAAATGDEEAIKQTIEEQEKQSEMMYRILDLRNADRATINQLNRQRIIDDFGNGIDCGSSFVQVALLTMKIRGLNEHLLSNPKDTTNKHALRLLIHHRARHLKYIKRKYPTRYDEILEDVGLDKRAVEGEIILRF